MTVRLQNTVATSQFNVTQDPPPQRSGRRQNQVTSHVCTGWGRAAVEKKPASDPDNGIKPDELKQDPPGGYCGTNRSADQVVITSAAQIDALIREYRLQPELAAREFCERCLRAVGDVRIQLGQSRVRRP